MRKEFGGRPEQGRAWPGTGWVGQRRGCNMQGNALCPGPLPRSRAAWPFPWEASCKHSCLGLPSQNGPCPTAGRGARGIWVSMWHKGRGSHTAIGQHSRLPPPSTGSLQGKQLPGVHRAPGWRLSQDPRPLAPGTQGSPQMQPVPSQGLGTSDAALPRSWAVPLPPAPLPLPGPIPGAQAFKVGSRSSRQTDPICLQCPGLPVDRGAVCVRVQTDGLPRALVCLHTRAPST